MKRSFVVPGLLLACSAGLAFPVVANAGEAKNAVPLPGEPCMRPALSPAPFPDRLSAFVWRNWGLVPVAELAAVAGAEPAEINAVAADMGLAPDPPVLVEWKTKGYITVLRRNWHLLPYEQLTTLLGKSREELRFSLMEDDFLWVKLGKVKPQCDRIVWSPEAAERGRAMRRRIARILKDEGLDPNAPEELRFAFVREIAAPSTSTSSSSSPSSSPFDFRLIFSYFADYGDPLGDPAVGSFPEGLLQKLSAQGVNAVWLHTVLRTLVEDPKYPEFGEGGSARLEHLRALVTRAAKYGIRVYLYMNEPRALPASSFERNPALMALRGACDDRQYALCTSCPETLRWLGDSLERVFARVPGLGGIFTITMSENLTHCASRKTQRTCSRCSDRRVADLIVETNRAMIDGMVRGNPKAEALVWNWAWPKDEEDYIVRNLPTNHIRLMAVSENAVKVRRGGITAIENDYSISILGPGENARRLWGWADERGIPAVAKVQAANSWELSSFPYIPAMDLVAQHAVNLANEGVGGVMLSWSLGCCPSPNLAVYRDLRKGEKTPDALLDRLAARQYGAANASRVRQAWKAFSDGFSNFPFALSTIYFGPQQWGPANPLYAEKTGYRATMVGIPYDDLDGWRANYPAETFAELMGKVADGFEEGCRLLDGIAPQRELDMFRAEQMHFASCRDQVRFIQAREAGDRTTAVQLARAELDRAKTYWRLVRADSRIGFESSNQYYYVPHDLLEKVLSCHVVFERLAERHK